MKSGDGITAKRISEVGDYPVYGGNGTRGFSDRYNRDGELTLIGRQGALCGAVHHTSGRIFASEHAIVCQAKAPNHQKFVSYVMHAMELNALSEASAQPGLSVEKLRRLCILLPPPSEQEAIAEALSDADGLIEGLKRLIAKKRLIKQGVMQDLLSARCRIPGFSGDWNRFTVREVVTRNFCGPSPTCEERNVSGDEWGVLKTTAITFENGWDWRKHKVLPKSFWGNVKSLVQVGDVIVTKAGPRHRVGVPASVDFVPKNILVSGKMIGLRPDSQRVTSLMLASAIASKEAQAFLDQRTTGMADSQVNFNNDDLLNTPILLPSIEEQTAISSIAADYDAEITTLEAWLDKARMVKEGMMQNLLTGRVRLV